MDSRKIREACKAVKQHYQFWVESTLSEEDQAVIDQDQVNQDIEKIVRELQGSLSEATYAEVVNMASTKLVTATKERTDTRHRRGQVEALGGVGDAIGALAAVAALIQQVGTPGPRFEDITVVREGKKIILPDGMTYAKAAEWCERMIKEEQEKIRINETVIAHPIDGAKVRLLPFVPRPHRETCTCRACARAGEARAEAFAQLILTLRRGKPYPLRFSSPPA